MWRKMTSDYPQFNSKAKQGILPFEGDDKTIKARNEKLIIVLFWPWSDKKKTSRWVRLDINYLNILAFVNSSGNLN